MNVPSPADSRTEANLQLASRQEGTLVPGPSAGARKRLRWALIAGFLVLLGLIPVAQWLWQRHQVNALWGQAESSLACHDLESAANYLDCYLKERPNDARGWFLAARTARRLQRSAEAERYLERSQQLGGVTDSTRLEWDLLRVAQGDVGGIDLRLRASITPDHPDALLVLEALARGYFRAERLADAREACTLWLTREPDHPWPWLWRGQLAERLNYLEMALEDYHRAVQNDPEDREARLALGGLLLRKKQADDATEHFESILARTPDDVTAQIGLAACRIGLGHAPEAVPLLDHALEQNPKSEQALLLRGKAALEQDQPEKAERWLRQAVGLAPYDSEAVYQLAQALRALNKDEEAARLNKRVEQLRKDNARLEELERMIVRQPDDPRARHEAGVLSLRMGRTEEGVRLLHSLLRLKGDHRDTHAVLADYYRQKDDVQRAEYHRSLAEDPPR
jgi:tetratricopeptide (TPR) repeat protein